MSISTRSTKAAMYSEIERLRALLDQRDLQIATQAETIRRRDAQIEELSAPQPSAAPRGRTPTHTRNEMMKRLAITCQTTVKWVDGQGFKQYIPARGWVAVPQHTVEYVSKGMRA